MTEAIMELLLVWTVGCIFFGVTFYVGDAFADWFMPRWKRAKERLAWQEVAARHKRKVKF